MYTNSWRFLSQKTLLFILFVFFQFSLNSKILAENPSISQLVVKRQIESILYKEEIFSKDNKNYLKSTIQTIQSLLETIKDKNGEVIYPQNSFKQGIFDSKLEKAVINFQLNYLGYKQSDLNLGVIDKHTILRLIALAGQQQHPFSLSFYTEKIKEMHLNNDLAILAKTSTHYDQAFIKEVQIMLAEIKTATGKTLFALNKFHLGYYDQQMAKAVAEFQNIFMNIATDNWASGMLGKNTLSTIKKLSASRSAPNLVYAGNFSLMDILNKRAKITTDGNNYNPALIKQIRELLVAFFKKHPEKFTFSVSTNQATTFDSEMKHAVQVFQKTALKIPFTDNNSGIVDSQTLTALYKENNYDLPNKLAQEPLKKSKKKLLKLKNYTTFKAPQEDFLSSKQLKSTTINQKKPQKSKLIISTKFKIKALLLTEADFLSIKRISEYIKGYKQIPTKNSTIIFTPMHNLFELFEKRMSKIKLSGKKINILNSELKLNNQKDSEIWLGDNAENLKESKNAIQLTLKRERLKKLTVSVTNYKLKNKQFIANKQLLPLNFTVPFYEKGFFVSGFFNKKAYWIIYCKE